MTLLYGLTAAPASQPRNAMLGQTISLTIAICVGYADRLQSWMQQSLATALAITCMCKLGFTHPPAGAAALLFATGDYGWGNLLFMLVGNIVGESVDLVDDHHKLLNGFFSFETHTLRFMHIKSAALGAATLINNWSRQRQYPSYWGVPPIDAYVERQKVAEAKKNE